MKKTLLVLLVLCCALALALAEEADPREEAYARAVYFMDETGEANYDDEAYEILWKMPGYRDADERCYRYGMQLIGMGEYEKAYKVFMRLSGYEDAEQKAYALHISFLCGLDYLTPTSAAYTFKELIGAVDFETNTIIPPKWTDGKQLTEDRYAVQENGVWGVIDDHGRYLFEPQWDGISPVKEGRCVTYSKDALGLIDLNGNVLQKCKWQQIGSSYVTEGGEAVLDEPLFLCGLIPAQNKRGLWGYIDENGAVAIEPQYLSATDFDTEQALAAVLTTDRIYKIITPDDEEAFFSNQGFFARIHAERYAAAQELIQAGKYEEAIEQFGALGFYRDSELQIQAAYLALGDDFAKEGEWKAAMTAYELAGEYPEASEKLKAAQNHLPVAEEPSSAEAANDAVPDKVWITNSSLYYHAQEHCSGMQNARSVTLTDAILLLRMPCPVCVGEQDAHKDASDSKPEPEPTPLPASAYSQIYSKTKKSDWMLDKSTRIKNGISQLEILTGENGGSVISFTGWSYGNREGFDGMTNNVCYVYVLNEKGDAVFYETTKAPGASGLKHTLKNGHNMEYADFTCVLDVSAYSNGTYSLGSCNHFMISGNTFYHGYTFGDAYSFTVVDGIVTSMGGVEN